MTLHPLLPKDEFIKEIKKRKRNLKITQKLLEDKLDLNQASISKLLTGKRGLQYEEAFTLVQIVVGLSSFLPNTKPIRDICTTSRDLVWVHNDDKLVDVAMMMHEKSFSQIPVKNRDTDTYIGIVTEESVLKKLLTTPPPFESDSHVQQLSNYKIETAGIIEEIPEYPEVTSIAEIGQLLVNYYAILLTDKGKITGIVTRADFLKLLFHIKDEKEI